VKRLIPLVLLLPALAQAQVTYVGVGNTSPTMSTGTCTPSLATAPTRQAGDLIVVIAEGEGASGNSGVITLGTANGFAAVSGAAAWWNDGDATDEIGETAVNLFWKIDATGSDSMPVIADSGDHTSCLAVFFRGADPTTPIVCSASDGTDAADTSGSFPGCTTGVADTMILMAESVTDDANDTTNGSGYSNSNLASITEREDQTSSTALGGGILFVTATYSGTGDFGTTTYTKDNTRRSAYTTIAIQPEPPVVGDGPIVRDTGGSTFPVNSNQTNPGATFTTSTFSTSGSADTLIVVTATWCNTDGFAQHPLSIAWSGGSGCNASFTQRAQGANTGTGANTEGTTIWTAECPSGTAVTSRAVQITSQGATGNDEVAVSVDAILHAFGGFGASPPTSVSASGSSVPRNVTFSGVTADSWLYVGASSETFPMSPVQYTTELQETAGTFLCAAANGVNTTELSGSVNAGWSGSAAWSATVGLEILTGDNPTLPGVPGNPTFTDVGQTTITVNWTSATGATSYKVERAPDVSGSPGTWGQIASGVTDLFYVNNSGLTCGTTYWYRVRATNGAGDGDYDTPASQATSACSGGGGTSENSGMMGFFFGEGGGGGGGGGSFALVQHLASTTSPPGKGETGNNFTFTLPNPVLAGNVLILTVIYDATKSLAATPITDTNGTWPTTAAASVDDGNGDLDMDMFVLPNAASGVHTITVAFTSATERFRFRVTEFSGIATSSPENGSAGSSNDPGPTINSGSFTPGDNDVNGGNLIYSVFADTDVFGNNATGYTAGGSFSLLDADIGWHSDASAHSAAEYYVQTTAASINPSITIAQSTYDAHVGLSLALKLASAGTAPGTDMRIVRLVNFTNQVPPASWTIQCPTTGNLLLLVTSDDHSLWDVTGITDNGSQSWSEITTGHTGWPQFWGVTNSTPSLDRLITVAGTGSIQAGSWSCYDIAGANTSAFGSVAGQDQVDVSNLTTKDNWPDLTPGQASGIAIARCALGQGPGTGFNTGAPAGAIWDFVNYTGQTDGSTYNNSDCAGHVWTTSTSTLNWNWTMAATNPNSMNASAVHFKAP
jgi:hypothetical protein